MAIWAARLVTGQRFLGGSLTVAIPSSSRLAGYDLLNGQNSSLITRNLSALPWKRDAAGPVRPMEHGDDLQLVPLEASTLELWQETQTVLGITDASTPTGKGPA